MGRSLYCFQKRHASGGVSVEKNFDCIFFFAGFIYIPLKALPLLHYSLLLLKRRPVAAFRGMAILVIVVLRTLISLKALPCLSFSRLYN